MKNPAIAITTGTQTNLFRNPPVQSRKHSMKSRGKLIGTAVFLCCLMWTSLAGAGSGRAYFSTTLGYRGGDFGTDTNYRLFYLTPAVGYAARNYEAAVSTSLLSAQSSGTQGSESETGLGDVLIRGSHKIITEDMAGFTLSGGLAVKLPTADKNKGLGTGEADFGGFILLKKAFGSFALMGQGGYIINGDSALQKYNDVPVYALGLSRAFNAGEIAVFYENKGAYVSGADTAQDIYLSGFYMLNKDYAVQAALSFGLSDASADVGASFGFVRWF